MIDYVDSLVGITPEMLEGFFEGWPQPPSPQTHLRILRNSARVVLAVDRENRKVIGFINALSDGILFAYIPLLEVLPAYRGRGIGKELVRRMMAGLGGLYAIDLLCDRELQAFYAACGMSPTVGMMVRNRDTQGGVSG